MAPADKKPKPDKPTKPDKKPKRPTKPGKTEGHLVALSDAEMVVKHGNRFPTFAITAATPVNIDGVPSSVAFLAAALEAAVAAGEKVKVKVYQDAAGTVTSILATTEDEPEEKPAE